MQLNLIKYNDTGMPNRKLTKTQSSVVEVSSVQPQLGQALLSIGTGEFSMSRIAAILDCDWKVPFSPSNSPYTPYA